MAGRSGRIGLVVALLGLMLPLPAWAARDAVAMRCTKGSLPSPTGSAGPSAVGPRITRDLVVTTATPESGTPRPLSEAGTLAGAEAAGPRLVVTVNF